MGIYKQGAITNYWPDNDENTLYLGGSMTFSEIMEQIRTHFGECDLSNFTAEGERIHTRCIYFDLHDPSDWDDFLVIRRIK